MYSGVAFSPTILWYTATQSRLKLQFDISPHPSAGTGYSNIRTPRTALTSASIPASSPKLATSTETPNA